jgi:hypothetical protein
VVAQILAFMVFVVVVPLIGTAMVPINWEPRRSGNWAVWLKATGAMTE